MFRTAANLDMVEAGGQLEVAVAGQRLIAPAVLGCHDDLNLGLARLELDRAAAAQPVRDHPPTQDHRHGDSDGAAEPAKRTGEPALAWRARSGSDRRFRGFTRLAHAFGSFNG